MTDFARVGIGITADDRTAKGVASATKRVSGAVKRIDRESEVLSGRTARSVVRSGSSIVRTFGRVEQAGARAFGGRSLTGGFATRLAAIGDAGAAAGSGLGEAATAGGVLSGAMTGLGIVAAGTIGVLAAAGFAAFKMASGWASGAASLGRLSQTIGVATRDLQAFTAAGERAGVDKGAASGALGGIAQTLNDARYGRNNEALALTTRLGVKFRNGADGQLDTVGMTMDIADAIARQKNAQTRRLVASKFGISDEALPMFAQGSAALRTDMADAAKRGPVMDDAEIAKGTRIARKGVIASQMAERGKLAVGSAAASAAEPGYDAVIAGGRAIMDGSASFSGVVRNTFKPAAEKIERAANVLANAVTRVATGLSKEVIGEAQAAQRKWHVPASVQLAQYGVESAWGRRMPRGSNNPFGIKARAGEPYVLAPTTEIINGRAVRVMGKFRAYKNRGEAFDDHARLLATGKYNRQFRAALPNGVDAAVEQLGHGTSKDPRYATDPDYGKKLRSTIHSRNLDSYDHIPVKVEIEMKGAPAGTRTKVTAGKASPPVVSQAMVH